MFLSRFRLPSKYFLVRLCLSIASSACLLHAAQHQAVNQTTLLIKKDQIIKKNTQKAEKKPEVQKKKTKALKWIKSKQGIVTTLLISLASTTTLSTLYLLPSHFKSTSKAAWDENFHALHRDRPPPVKNPPWINRWQTKFLFQVAPFNNQKKEKLLQNIRNNNQDPTYPYQTTLFKTPFKNGQTLQGYAMSSKSQKKNNIAILRFKGNGESYYAKRHRSFTTTPEDYAALLDKGYTLYEFDYLGTALSQGKFHQEADLEDFAQACYNYITHHHNHIILVGKSLGGICATHLARHLLTQTGAPKIRALLLDGIFYNAAFFHGKESEAFYKKILSFSLDNSKNLQAICQKKFPFPIHIIHGRKDYTIPYENMEKLKSELADQKRKLAFYTHYGDHYMDHEDQRLLQILNNRLKGHKVEHFFLDFNRRQIEWQLA